MAGFKRRYVWVVIAPKAAKDKEDTVKVKAFFSEEAMRESIPQKYRVKPKKDASGKFWTFGRQPGRKFIAKRVPVIDSDGLPV